jgi:putative transposase
MHLVQRGVNRERVFFRERDYADYLGLLTLAARQSGCSIHAFCLMPNHVHLLVTPGHSASCAALMKQVNQRYGQRLNHSKARTGTLWEGRSYSALVDTERYALACYRYIELNPVRAMMVSAPRDYRWSSYRSNAEGRFDPLVTRHLSYLALEADSERRCSLYRSLFDTALEQSVIDEIRKATRGGYRVGEQRPKRGRRARAPREQPGYVPN